jgi:hypothetical protein
MEELRKLHEKLLKIHHANLRLSHKLIIGLCSFSALRSRKFGNFMHVPYYVQELCSKVYRIVCENIKNIDITVSDVTILHNIYRACLRPSYEPCGQSHHPGPSRPSKAWSHTVRPDHSSIWRPIEEYTRFEVLAAVETNRSVTWELAPCSPVKVNRTFGGTCRLRHKTPFALVSCLAHFSTLTVMTYIS